MHTLSWMNTSLMWALFMWNLQSDPGPVWEEAEQRVMCHWWSLVGAPVCVSWRERQPKSRRKVGRDPTATRIAQELLLGTLSDSINTKKWLNYTYCRKKQASKDKSPHYVLQLTTTKCPCDFSRRSLAGAHNLILVLERRSSHVPQGWHVSGSLVNPVPSPLSTG